MEMAVGETQEQVAQIGGIEDISVKQRRRLLQAEFLVARDQFVKHIAAPGEDIFDPDTDQPAGMRPSSRS